MIEQFIGDSQFLEILGLSILCGGLIGLERQVRGKPSGMRTSMLICLGTATFVHLGAYVGGGTMDPSRVLGQVVTGIGFLGAGVMFAKEGTVLGVTTAAVIWVLAGIGASIGLGAYHLGVALTLSTLLILIVCEWLEKSFAAFRRGVHELYRPNQKNNDDNYL